MTTYTSLVYDAGAGIELVRRVSTVPSGAQSFTRCVVSSTGHLWTYAAGVWSDQGPAAPSIGGGGGGGSGNIDGGNASSVYGGIDPIDGGSA